MSYFTGTHIGLFVAMLGATGFACRSKLDVKTAGAVETSSKCGTALAGGAPGPAAAPGAADKCPEPEPEPEVKKDEPKTETATETAADPVPTEMLDKFNLQGKKTYFQTRDVISVSIPTSMIDGGSAYRIVNVTKEGDADNPEVLTLIDEAIDSDTAKLRSTWHKNKRMAIVKSGDNYVFAFYPGKDAWKGKFYYGKNKLKLEVDDAANPRFSYLPEITLKDFEVFGIAMTSFGTNSQVAQVDGGGEFQGWVNELSAPSVAVLADPNDPNSVSSKLTTGVFNLVNPH